MRYVDEQHTYLQPAFALANILLKQRSVQQLIRLLYPDYSTVVVWRAACCWLLVVGCCCLQVKPPAFDQHRYLQRLNERCELMSLLTHLYVGADALKPHADSSSQPTREMTLSPDIYAAQMLLQQITSRADQEEADQAEAEALTGPLKELSAMKWPSCSEQQFLSLLEKLGAAVYAASAGTAAATAPADQLLLPYTGAAGRAATEAAGGSGSKGSRSQALELQQLSEALVSSSPAFADVLVRLSLFYCCVAGRQSPLTTVWVVRGAHFQAACHQTRVCLLSLRAAAGHITRAGRPAPGPTADGHG